MTPAAPGTSTRAMANAERRAPHRSDGVVEGALARLEQLVQLAGGQPLEVLARAVRVERRLVDVLLVDDERARALAVAARDVVLAARLLARRLGELLHRC